MAHPCGVAAGEVVVHRDELHVLACEGVEVERQSGHEGLALARLHLGDLALVEHDAAYELAVEGDHVPRERVAAHLGGGAHQAAAGVLHERERLWEKAVESDLLLREATPELGRHARIVLGREVLSLVLGLDAVDLRHNGAEPLQVAGVLGAKDFLENVHRVI